MEELFQKVVFSLFHGTLSSKTDWEKSHERSCPALFLLNPKGKCKGLTNAECGIRNAE